MTRPDDAPEPDDRAADRAGAGSDDLEAPAADAAEQSMPANPVEQPVQVRRDGEVGEWDAVEQAIVVDLEDDYDR